MLPSRRSESVLPPEFLCPLEAAVLSVSAVCVPLSLFHPALPFDLKVNAAASAFSVSQAFFSFTPLLAS